MNWGDPNTKEAYKCVHIMSYVYIEYYNNFNNKPSIMTIMSNSFLLEKSNRKY